MTPVEIRNARKVIIYRLKAAAILSLTPIICAALLIVILATFSHLNLYFLEANGLIVSDEVRAAYFDQVILELQDGAWMTLLLVLGTAGVSYIVMMWATSPFTSGEAFLRHSLTEDRMRPMSNKLLSEAPEFSLIVARLARRVHDPEFAFDQFPEARYRFNWRFFLKFVAIYAALSVLSGYLFNIQFSAIYLKVVSLGVSLIQIRQRGHYFVAQYEILQIASNFCMVISFLIYAVSGYYVTRYLSNMTFVFTRAIRERHFPLRLRDSDVYHSLAATISAVAEKAGLSKKAS